ncbi:MAG TPA: 23S rRNA (uracil(1939)-C(5))-methyltransferase RlmD [Bacteroidota bacterium]|nr:23S rRNA (uracil(1939)-C(5))-methyltransferase RlmD [Bacteroidota bacterium]
MPDLIADAPPAVSGLRRGDTITVKADSLSGEGTSVGRFGGLVCFIEDAVPGDVAVVRLSRIKKQYLAGRAVRILSPSGLRTEPACAHFGVCGGCQWQSLSYDAQLTFKRQRVTDVFQRISGIGGIDVRPVLGCPDPYHYRNKMEYTFSNDRWLTPEEFAQPDDRPRTLVLGLHLSGRYDKILGLRECRLQSPSGEAILLATGEYFCGRGVDAYSTRTHSGYLRHLVVREGKKTGETMVNIVTTDDRPEEMRAYSSFILGRFPGITTVVNNITDRKSMVAQGDREAVYHGPGTIREKIGRYSYRISANSFFQTNTVQAEALFDAVVDLAGFTPSDVVYDLYCGTGAIAIYISEHAGQIVGIEVNESAVADAGRNAAENGVTNCRFIRAALPEGLDPGSAELAGIPPPTVVVVDPPRSGLHEKLIGKIIRLYPAKVVYVSCNAATQARDVKFFTEAGYKPGPVQPVDMFPHTDHVETVAVLSR